MAKKSTRSTSRKMPEFRLARVKALQERIRQWKTQALLVTNDRDIRYLTGFVGEDSWAIVQANSDVVTVISDSRFEEEIPHVAPGVKTVIRQSTTLQAELGKLFKKHRMKKIALQQSYVTLAQKKAIAKELSASKLQAVDDGLLKQRATKDKEEVRLIQKAVRIQEEAFTRTCRYIKPGMTEGEIAGYLEMQMRALGAEGPGFDTIVGTGANSSKPHYTPGLAKVKQGNVILIDWGATYEGYKSDMTRVVTLGKWPRKIKEIYPIVLDAHLAAADKIAPGVPLYDIWKAAHDVIRKAGYAKQFRHGLGHGIGLNIHESPNMSHRSKGELEPDQVVTVEPGIYLAGIGGVRIEDDILVTAKGHRVMCDLPKDMESAII